MHEVIAAPRAVARGLFSALASALLFACGLVGPAHAQLRTGLSVSIPNGYANVSVEDMRVMSTAGAIRIMRTWDGKEWKLQPQWESLSQSWRNLTGSQSIDMQDGSATRDPATLSSDSQVAPVSQPIASAGGSVSGCWVMVDEDWQPSGQTISVGGYADPARVMLAERVAPFNRAMSDAVGADYPVAVSINVDWLGLCGGSIEGAVSQAMEGLRRGGELYLGNEGRFAFNSRATMAKQAVRQLPRVAVTDPYAQLQTGQISAVPATLANGYRWSDKAGDWAEYDNRGQMVAWGDRNANTVWLVRDAGGTLRGVVDANGRVAYTFHYTGALVTEIRDYPVAGNALDLPARRVQYQYDVANRLRTVVDVRGNTTGYAYSPTNNLTAITDPEGHTETLAYRGDLVQSRTAPDGGVTDYAFSYDAANRQYVSRVIGPATEAGRMVSDTTHNRAGKPVRVMTNDRVDAEYRYDTGTRTESVTNARGFTTRTTKNEFAQDIEIAYADGGVVRRSYSALNLQLTRETDELGVVTEYGVDAAGNRLSRIEAKDTPDERTTLYERNALGQVTRVTVSGRTEANGSITPDAVWQVSEYDALGQIRTTIDPEGHTHRLVFDRAGSTVRYTNPRGHATDFGVDAAGNLTRITDALNHVTQLRYDRTGNLVEQTDARNKTTLMAYEDAMNRLTRSTNPVGGSRRTTYNAQGLPIVQRDEDDRALQLGYDNFQRLTRLVDGLNNLTEFSYTIPDGSQAGLLGSLSLPTETRYPTFTQRQRYDQRERNTSQTLINPTAQGTQALTSATAYDRRGQPRIHTDAYAKERAMAYSSLGSAIEFTDALLNKTKARYDVRGNLLELEDANGNVTRFEYDRNDRLVRETLPLGQMTRYRYDAAGNLDQRIDALGQTDSYVYDAANRLEQAERRDAANALQRTSTFGWDETNNLIAWSDTDHTGPVGQQTSSSVLSYDDAGRKTGEIVTYPNGRTLTYGYAYSPAGKKTRLAWPDGTQITYGYSAHGQLQSVTIPGEGTIGVESFRWTEPARIAYPGGHAQTNTYTGLLNLESLQLETNGLAALSLTHTYGNQQELKTRSRSDTVNATTSHRQESFGYDNEIRLRSVTESLDAGAPQTETFTLDALANRTQHSRISGTWQYDANNRILRQGEGDLATTYGWDANGNLITKTEPSNKVTRYFYDGLNRLVRVTDGTSAQVIARYGYDPFNRRLWKEQYRDIERQALSPAKRTFYLYADEGLVAEATEAIQLNPDQTAIVLGAHEITTQYAPTPSSPFTTNALLLKTRNQGNTDTFAYLQRDQQGTPIRAMDRSGNTVWAASYGAFGKATVTTPSAALASTIELNLRLPGQYFDVETGLHYNWNRYYDQALGKYLQYDPVGLSDGMSAYVYGKGDPVNRIDPNGLWSTRAHSAILKAAFPGATPEMLAALQAGSKNADSYFLGYQGDDYAFMHAMTSQSLNVQQSCKKLNEYFATYFALYQSNINSAINWSAQGNRALTNLAIHDAYFALGFALHPVMDNTSPAHAGFVKWRTRDSHRHGNFWTSLEDVEDLTPELLNKTIKDIYDAMKTGVGVNCGC